MIAAMWRARWSHTPAPDPSRAAHERLFHWVQANKDHGIALLDRDGRVVAWNVGAAAATGFDARDMIGQPIGRLQPESDAADWLGTAARDGRFATSEWIRRGDGCIIWAHVVIDPVRDATGTPAGFVAAINAMTDHGAATIPVAALARTVEAAVATMSQGLTIFDANERLVLANPRVRTIYGLSDADTALGVTYIDFIRAIKRNTWDPSEAEARAQASYAVQRALIQQPGGGTMIVTGPGRVTAIAHQSLADGFWFTTHEDITERQRSDAMITHITRHDALTGLPNRGYFAGRLDDALAAAAPDQSIALMSIDLTAFKTINDSHGHAAGDKILQVLAQRMLTLRGPGELMARDGSDEFVGFKTFTHDDTLLRFVARAEGWFAAPIVIDETPFQIEGSIGLAVYPRDGTSRDQLLNNAVLARQRARHHQNIAACFYEASMDEGERARRILAADLASALERRQFHLVYQVQKSLATGETLGYEALLRWTHPARGLVPPAEFIPLAEATGSIVAIGDWVLRTACAEAASWARPLTVAVNLSAVQLGEAGLAQTIHQILMETGLVPARLELEITETSVVGDKVRAQHILRQLRALGVRIAIDDFGTGHASLDTLSSFPFTKIKIDRSFLARAEASPQARAIIRTIIGLGRSLDMPVLAEGVETSWQSTLLRAEGCEEAQGYLLGRPMDATQIARRAAIAGIG